MPAQARTYSGANTITLTSTRPTTTEGVHVYVGGAAARFYSTTLGGSTTQSLRAGIEGGGRSEACCVCASGHGVPRTCAHAYSGSSHQKKNFAQCPSLIEPPPPPPRRSPTTTTQPSLAIKTSDVPLSSLSLSSGRNACAPTLETPEDESGGQRGGHACFLVSCW